MAQLNVNKEKPDSSQFSIDPKTPVTPSDEAAAYEDAMKAWEKGKPDATGKVSATSGATQQAPTFSRSQLGAGIQSIFAAQNSPVNPDSVSKVIGENGEPMVVAHSTKADFSIFSKTQQNDAGWLGEGYYFFGDRSLDGQYGDKVMEVFLNIKEPYYTTEEDLDTLSEANDHTVSREFTQSRNINFSIERDEKPLPKSQSDVIRLTDEQKRRFQD